MSRDSIPPRRYRWGSFLRSASGGVHARALGWQGDTMLPPHASAVPSTVRIWNERAVLSSLHDGRAWRAAQIADATGLTPASVRDMLRTLVAKGRVRSLDPEQAGAMGRPARTFQHARPDGLTLGIHLDEKIVRMVVGEVFGKARVVGEIPIASDDADEAAGG